MIRWLVVFVACATVDILWLGWTRSGRQGNAWHAALYSAAIQLVGVVSILIVVSDHGLLVPNVLGHSIGSYVGVAWSRHEREVKQRTKAERSKASVWGTR